MAKIPAFKPVKSQDKVLTLIQQNLGNSLSAALANPLLSGNGVDILFGNANTDLQVTHGLGNSTNVRWLVGTLSQAGSIYLSPNNGNPALNPNQEQQIILRSNMAQLSAHLWFFNAG